MVSRRLIGSLLLIAAVILGFASGSEEGFKSLVFGLLATGGLLAGLSALQICIDKAEEEGYENGKGVPCTEEDIHPRVVYESCPQNTHMVTLPLCHTGDPEPRLFTLPAPPAGQGVPDRFTFRRWETPMYQPYFEGEGVHLVP